MTKDPQFITDAVVQEALTDAFRRHVGQGKAHSVCEIAAATGGSDTLWGMVRSGCKVPSLRAVLQAAVAMGDEGPEFLNGILGAAGFTGVRPIDPGHFCPHRTTGDLAKAIATIAEALEDKDIDASERALIRAQLLALGRMGDTLKVVS
ncbi:MAG: hypothetical protein VYB54_04755 [Pseudomonadota bacterium]|nr:hypothetical protein [Pseudomonadota bacterium]